MIVKPWVGRYYSEGMRGKKIVIVGESFYGEEVDLSENLTSEIVERYCAVDFKTHKGESVPFFSKIATLLLEKEKADDVSWSELGDFYNRVAFCNFLQGFAGNSADGYATDEDFEASVSSFISIVKNLEPDVVVVFKTKQLMKHFPDLPIRTVFIQHPSRGWSYDDWRLEASRIWE